MTTDANASLISPRSMSFIDIPVLGLLDSWRVDLTERGLPTHPHQTTRCRGRKAIGLRLE